MLFTLARPAAGLALLSALAAGCGTAAAAHSTTPRPAASSAPSAAGAGGRTVTATETDFHIALSQQAFSPGTYTFVAADKGQLPHNLIINGPGVNQAMTPGLLSPGESGQVTVTLRKGTYDVYCGVPGHKDQGMDVHITVR